MCKDQGCHVRPPEHEWSYMTKDGTHSRDLEWDPSCPLAALEYVWQHQHEEDVPKRCYPAYLPKRTTGPARLAVKNISLPSQAAVDFMQVQGLPLFDTNSGRKALARWCKHLNVPYELSVHIHGDLFDTWNKNYESEVEKPRLTIRQQSRDPKEATAALRIFASWLNRGFDPYQQPMSLVERQNHMLLSIFGQPGVANRIRLGMDAYHANPDIPPMVEVPAVPTPMPIAPPSKRKRESKKPARLNDFTYQLSDIDSDEDLKEYLTPRPKRKKRKKAPNNPEPYIFDPPPLGVTQSYQPQPLSLRGGHL